MHKKPGQGATAMLSLGPIRDWAFLKVAVRAQGQQLLFLVYAWGTCCLAQVHGLLLCGASAWAIAVWRKCMGYCCVAQVHGLLLYGAGAWAIAVWRKCMGYCCVAQVHGLLLCGASAWAIAVWRKCMGYCCVAQVHGLLLCGAGAWAIGIAVWRGQRQKHR